ncbi:MAG: hypothetical protein ORN28_11965 [Rhodoferax sp.]|nr:hypothetical protein [Rhodoferax sp.]
MSVVKSHVVCVRVEPHTKEALHLAAGLAADRQLRSLANMIEVMVVSYCQAQGYPLKGVPDETLSNTNPQGSAA